MADGTPRLRIVFFGTPEVAVPTLERLLAGPHEVVAVVSQPDRGRGRGRKSSPSPVAAVAMRESLPLLRPEQVGDEETIAALRALQPDIGVVVAFGQFLPKKLRELPGRGYLINAHASLLPRHRGASPIAQAILEGDAETGVSVMRIEREMDAGPVALVRRTPIDPDENTAELTARLSKLAAEAIAETLDRIARDEIEWREQDASEATLAPKLDKADAPLDLRTPAATLVRRIHALAPRPGATLRLIADGADADASEPGEILKILRARAEEATGAADPLPAPGRIRLASEGVPLRIATGSGWLVPRVLQRAGGRALAVEDFLRGFALSENARFATPASKGSDETGAGGSSGR